MLPSFKFSLLVFDDETLVPSCENPWFSKLLLDRDLEMPSLAEESFSLFLDMSENATWDWVRNDRLLLPGAMPQFDNGGAAEKEEGTYYIKENL